MAKRSYIEFISAFLRVHEGSEEVHEGILSPNQSERFVLADPLFKINSLIERLTEVNNDVNLLHVCFSHKAIV